MALFTHTDYQAMALSARVALTATAISIPFGFAAAYLLVFTRVRGKRILDGLINLPLVLPPVVVGYLLLLSLRRPGLARLASRPLAHSGRLYLVGGGHRLAGGRFSPAGALGAPRHGGDRRAACCRPPGPWGRPGTIPS